MYQSKPLERRLLPRIDLQNELGYYEQHTISLTEVISGRIIQVEITRVGLNVELYIPSFQYCFGDTFILQGIPKRFQVEGTLHVATLPRDLYWQIYKSTLTLYSRDFVAGSPNYPFEPIIIPPIIISYQTSPQNEEEGFGGN
jgi:hypothetical protein